MIWALWNVFGGPFRSVSLKVNKTFTRRVTRFIDLGLGKPVVDRPGQQGADQQYNFTDAMELATALALGNGSMPQAEIVKLLCDHRDNLIPLFEEIYEATIGQRCFVVIRSRLFQETYREIVHFDEATNKLRVDAFDPKIIGGHSALDGLKEELADLNARSSVAMVIELVDIATSLRSYLSDAPKFSRAG